jgi:hypothetical protein
MGGYGALFSHSSQNYNLGRTTERKKTEECKDERTEESKQAIKEGKRERVKVTRKEDRRIAEAVVSGQQP